MNSLASTKTPFVVVVDMHGTLINSNFAFLEAFAKLNPRANRKQLEKRIYLKESRHKIASEYGLNYQNVISEYSKCNRINRKLVVLLRSMIDYNIPVVVITSATGKRCAIDKRYILNYIKPAKFIQNVKKSKMTKSFWSRLKKMFGTNLVLYIGNDPEEDAIHFTGVISLLNAEFVERRLKITRGSAPKVIF